MAGGRSSGAKPADGRDKKEIMKAKEYYKEFLSYEKNFGENRAFYHIAVSFAVELTDIAKKRNAHSDQALISILRELNKKWNAMMHFDSRFKRDGFIEFMKHKMPFLKEPLEIEERQNV